MSNAFNFGSLANVKENQKNSYLKPYNIYKNVAITGLEVAEGVSAAGKPWKCLKVTFSNDQGSHTESIFWINSEEDFKRKSVDMPNGGKRQLPSNWESTRDKMAAIGLAFNRASFEKLQALSSKIKTFDDLMTYYKKVLETAITNKTTTNMKLVGKKTNGTVYATLPNCTGIAQANTADKAATNGVEMGEWYTWMVSPFGNDLSFTSYEETQRNNYINAKPTEMSNDPLSIDSNEDGPIDTDELLAGL